MRSHTKLGLNRFSCFYVYWKQTDRHPDKQSIYRRFSIRFFKSKTIFITLNVKQFQSYSVKIREIIVKNAPISVLFQLMINWVRPMTHFVLEKIYLNI